MNLVLNRNIKRKSKNRKRKLNKKVKVVVDEKGSEIVRKNNGMCPYLGPEFSLKLLKKISRVAIGNLENYSTP